MEEFLDSLKSDHARSVVLFGKQSKRVAHFNFFELRVLLEGKDAEELMLINESTELFHCLGKNCFLLLIRFKTCNLEHPVKPLHV